MRFKLQPFRDALEVLENFEEHLTSYLVDVSQAGSERTIIRMQFLEDFDKPQTPEQALAAIRGLRVKFGGDWTRQLGVGVYSWRRQSPFNGVDIRISVTADVVEPKKKATPIPTDQVAIAADAIEVLP